MRVESGHEDAPATTFHRHTHHRWRAYLDSTQHNYAHWTHWTRVTLPEGRWDLANLERIPSLLPSEIYAQASPLRLISWCSFELTQAARRLLRDLRFCAKTQGPPPEIGGPDCLAKHTGPERTRGYAVSRNACHSAHRIQSSNAHIHDNAWCTQTSRRHVGGT